MLDPKALEAALSAADRVYLTTTTESTSSHVAVEAGITAYLQAVQPAVADAAEALRNVSVHLELAQDIAALPLYNELEVGFRHSPLSPKETMQRYAESFEVVSQDIKFALEYLAKATAALGAAGEPVAWQPIETAPREQEVLIAYWRWRSSMSPGSIIVQSARQVEYHGSEIWSWVVEDNKHGPFPIRGWCDGDMIGWQPLPAAPQGASHDE